jgi:hypothetical protein
MPIIDRIKAVEPYMYYIPTGKTRKMRGMQLERRLQSHEAKRLTTVVT